MRAEAGAAQLRDGRRAGEERENRGGRGAEKKKKRKTHRGEKKTIETVLSERKRLILKAIIDAHISFGEPVGSKFLSENQQLNCSSATIRNEMAELEKMGYLEQPHTSAGRVPTEAGYRYYVDSLSKSYSLTALEIEQINRTLRHKIGELDQILADASRLLSRFTNYTGIAIRPKCTRMTVKRFDCAYIDETSFVLIMVLSDGNAKTRIVRSPLTMTVEETKEIAEILNSFFRDKSGEGISLSLLMKAERELSTLAPILQPVSKAVYDVLQETDGGILNVEGVGHLLEYPEYSDADRLKGMLSFLEKKDGLMELVSSGEKDGELQVHIGSENAVDAMNHSSFIYRTVKRGGQVVGAVGVIGPCRMDYSKVISILNQLSSGIADAIDGDGYSLGPADESGKKE
ncbi:MAG: heat-inducible transcriptional repressor HrcA [Clostridia bacterium]|nr:heat-inducible transcriptional repressor HrcA [Clostridia bacterium]